MSTPYRPAGYVNTDEDTDLPSVAPTLLPSVAPTILQLVFADDSDGVARRSAPDAATRPPSLEHHRQWPAVGDYNYDDDYVEVEEDGNHDEDYDFDDDDIVDDDEEDVDFKGGGAKEKEAERESGPGTQGTAGGQEEPAKVDPKEAALDNIGEGLDDAGKMDNMNPGVRLALPSVLLLALAAYWYRGGRGANRRWPSFALPCARCSDS